MLSGQLVERHLRFDHPEFGQVARGVAVFGPERRAKRVAVAHGCGEGLRFQLPAHGQRRRFAEEVLLPVDFGLAPTPGPFQVQSRHLKHLPRTLAVAGGDDRRVEVQETARLEEVVNRRD